MKIFQAFSLLTIAHGSKVTRINLRKEGEGLGSRLGRPGRFSSRDARRFDLTSHGKITIPCLENYECSSV